MSVWSGPMHRGAARERREEKRHAAIQRQEAYRKMRAIPVEPAPRPVGARPRCPGLVEYASAQDAYRALARLPRSRKNGALRPFECQTGAHWHLGQQFSRPDRGWRAA